MIRTSIMAEIKVLSAASLKVRLQDTGKYTTWMSNGSKADKSQVLQEFFDCFVSIGLASNLTISEDWGTTPVQSIGAPTRPVMVPNNYSVTASIERLTLDRRNNWSYVTSPDYWYSVEFQKKMGLHDWLAYTYLTVADRESTDPLGPEIYALMPRSARQGISSQNAFVSHSVELSGFKYRYNDLLSEIIDDKGVLGYNRTVSYGSASTANPGVNFGEAINSNDGEDT